MTMPSWTDIGRGLAAYVGRSIVADLDNIRWVLPMACLIGFYIWMIFSAVDLIMENRERAGRYAGLNAISYLEDTMQDDVGLKCGCGQVVPRDQFVNFQCPECRLVEILTRDDMPAPDMAALSYGPTDSGVFTNDPH